MENQGAGVRSRMEALTPGWYTPVPSEHTTVKGLTAGGYYVYFPGLYVLSTNDEALMVQAKDDAPS